MISMSSNVDDMYTVCTHMYTASMTSFDIIDAQIERLTIKTSKKTYYQYENSF